MPTPSLALKARPGAAPVLKPVNLAALTAKQLAGLLLAPPSQLAVDCGRLLMPHPLGVGCFVSQLLVIRSRGTCFWLCNVHPRLHRCLHQLGLGALFHLNGPALPIGAAR